jgi:type I restriction enzyme M protein
LLWIAPSEKDTNTAALEKRLWDAADQFRANSGLKAQEYSAPVLGLNVLRFADVRFVVVGFHTGAISAEMLNADRVHE